MIRHARRHDAAVARQYVRKRVANAEALVEYCDEHRQDMLTASALRWGAAVRASVTNTTAVL